MPGELGARLLRVLRDQPDALQRFVIRAIPSKACVAIANELQRKQSMSRKQALLVEVASLQAEMEAAGTWVDEDEVCGDWRSLSENSKSSLENSSFLKFLLIKSIIMLNSNGVEIIRF